MVTMEIPVKFDVRQIDMPRYGRHGPNRRGRDRNRSLQCPQPTVCNTTDVKLAMKITETIGGTILHRLVFSRTLQERVQRMWSVSYHLNEATSRFTLC
jgi:hypothetical protein